MRRRLADLQEAFDAREVAPESLTLAAILISATAGMALAAGGAAGDLRLWLLVPPLGLFRLAVDALVDFRHRTTTDQEVRNDGDR